MTDGPAAGNIQGVLHIATPLGSRRKKIKKFAGTLYVNRPVLNADELIAWAKEYAGCETCVTPDDMHVTVAFSREPLDWPQPMKDVKLTIPVKNAHVKMFGPEGDCVVLAFDSDDLQERWQGFIDAGASWSWPDYSPHVTLSYHGFNRNGITPREIPPFNGRIVLGPEEFGEVTEGWGDNVVQKIGWTDEARSASIAARQAGRLPVQPMSSKRVSFPTNPTVEKGLRERLRGEEYAEYSSYPVESVPAKDLASSFQREVNPEVVKNYANDLKGGKDFGDHPFGIRYKGKVYVQDGHHRVEAALRSGRDKVNMHVQDLDKVKKGADMNDDFFEQDRIQKIGRRNNSKDQKMIQTMHDHACALGADCNGLIGYDTNLTSNADAVDKVARIAKIDESLGLVFGYAIVCTKDGKPYYDLNVDKAEDGTYKRVPEHIPEDAMLKAAVDFMGTDRVGNEMHKGDDVGTYVFAFPLTADIAKAFGIQTNTTGLMIAYKPTPEVFAKFKSGEYTGFSIEGRRVSAVETE